MSYRLLRPLLFRLPPEAAHAVATGGLDVLARLGLAPLVARPPAPLPVEAMGLRFPNPVGLSAGFDKDADHLRALFALGFGFVEVGTVTPRPQAGNPRPRLFRIPQRQALINRLGFNNKGLEHLLGRVRDRGRNPAPRCAGVLGINIGKNRDTPNERASEDYLEGLRAVYTYADYVAVNVSSPNTQGLRDLQHGEALARLLRDLLAEREALAEVHGIRRPLVLKIAPDLDDRALAELADVLREHPPEGLCATNTTVERSAVAGLPHGEEAGGLSGAPLLARSNAVLAALAGRVPPAVCLIGVGGILRGEDAVTKIRAGARLVQFYTGFVYRGPALVGECVEALRAAARGR